MADVARGDLGHSFWNTEPIRETVARRGVISLEIAVLAVVFSWLVGVPAGILSATRRNSWLDNIVRLCMTLFLAIPSFWIGLSAVLVLVLVFTWRPPLTIVAVVGRSGRRICRWWSGRRWRSALAWPPAWRG